MKDKLIILAMLISAVIAAPLITGQARAESGITFPETLTVLLTENNETVTVSAEEYIIGCLSAQIPIDYEQESLNAQAAACATYALRLMSDLKKSPDTELKDADISDSTKICQPYYTEEKRRETYGGDYDIYLDRLEKAVEYGKNHIITYDNEPIYAVYHSVSAGRTCPSEFVWNRSLPYLKSAESGYDRGYINFECSNEITDGKARALLSQYSGDIEAPADYGKWFSEMNADENGYVISVKIGKNTFSGGDIWRIFGLRSTAFTVSYCDGIFTFVTKGFGHGAGLSQYGANEMAKSGKTAEEILSHYYGEKVRF